MKLELDAVGYTKRLKNLQEQKLPEPKVRALQALQVLTAGLPIADFIGLTAALCEQHGWLAEQLKVITVQEILAAPAAQKVKPSKPPVTRSKPGTTDLASSALLEVLKASKTPLARKDLFAAVSKDLPKSSLNTAWLTVRKQCQVHGVGPSSTYTLA